MKNGELLRYLLMKPRTDYIIQLLTKSSSFIEKQIFSVETSKIPEIFLKKLLQANKHANLNEEPPIKNVAGMSGVNEENYKKTLEKPFKTLASELYCHLL
ncbi:CLUMA_CG006422, isoform A [Clunio marinus]|uniref:CLUMA_CG006422, isoform A n=1 Tax=Clunio marinus TaxID=568069 RepID=A0A1J1HXW7_9DIPT|nr:CLUMA_CG006422, isoform A [Clunio marinus]